jgi:hypothetical protein
LKDCYRRNDTGRDNDGNETSGSQKEQPPTEIRAEVVPNVLRTDVDGQDLCDDEMLLMGSGERNAEEENEPYQRDLNEEQPHVQVPEEPPEEPERIDVIEEHPIDPEEVDQPYVQVPEEPSEEPERFDAIEEDPIEPEELDRPRRNVRQPFVFDW